MKVLLIEDSQSAAEAWRDRYTQLGFPEATVQHVTRLDMALALLERGEAYDLIVLDVNLPDHHGKVDVAISAIRKHAERTRIQVYTADSSITKREIERIDPYSSISYKFGPELNSFRQAVANALPENRIRHDIRHDIDVAIAELKTNHDNLWRELSETKKEFARQSSRDRSEFVEQFKQLRDLMQRSQDKVIMATEELPEMRAKAMAEIQRIQADLNKMDETLKSAIAETKDLEDFRDFVKSSASLMRWFANNRRIWLAGAGLLGLGFLPAIEETLRLLLELIAK